MQVGLVGVGRWGALILRDLQSLGCAVVAVARDSTSAAKVQGLGASAVGSVAELAGADGVVVATPTSTHADVLDEVLDLGVPTFVEKPLCDDLARAAALTARAPDRLFVMDKWRYHPGIMKLGELARTGVLGALLGVRLRRVSPGVNHDDVDALWVLAPHDLSIAREILGYLPEPRGAAAERASTAITGLTALLGSDPWVSIEVSSSSPEFLRLVEVRGTDATARLDDGWNDHVTIVRTVAGELSSTTVPTPGELPLLAELRAFVDHLRGGPPPRSSAAEGAEVVAMIERLRELAAQP